MAKARELLDIVTSLSRQTQVVAMASGKGGVGKTSIVANVAGLLAWGGGYRVLVISLDPQDDLGDDLGYDQETEGDGGEALAEALLRGRPLRPSLRDIRPDLDVICGGPHVEEIYERIVRDGLSTDLLAAALLDVADDYDWILLDLPPNNRVAQSLAFRAARWILIPSKSDRSSKRGIGHLARDYVTARADNPLLHLLGVIAFDVAASASDLRSRMREELEIELGEVVPVLDTTIRNAQKAAEAARARGLLMHELAEQRHTSWREARRIPENSRYVALEYQALIKEIILAMHSHQEQQ